MSPPSSAGFAPAKVNLFLHVGPPSADGYHPLASLMSFADVGDQVRLEAGAADGLSITGAFAADLAGEEPQRNLVWRAARALLQRAGVEPDHLRLVLDKALPVAAGLGGGSSDAGAALRIVRDRFAPQLDDDALEAIAGELGADGPACFRARPVLAEGRGDRLSPPPVMPDLPAVLVNPRVACSTARVYRAFDEVFDSTGPDSGPGADRPALPDRFETVGGVIAALALCRNDLERPALAVAPEIAPVLERLRQAPEAGLARLSGSGATCFALCETVGAAATLARRVAAERPDWWVRPCRLGGPWRATAEFTNP